MVIRDVQLHFRKLIFLVFDFMLSMSVRDQLAKAYSETNAYLLKRYEIEEHIGSVIKCSDREVADSLEAVALCL